MVSLHLRFAPSHHPYSSNISLIFLLHLGPIPSPTALKYLTYSCFFLPCLVLFLLVLSCFFLFYLILCCFIYYVVGAAGETFATGLKGEALVAHIKGVYHTTVHYTNP